MNLYLFDFDGTISDKDSMIAFIFFIKKKHKLIISLVLSLPYIFKYLFGIIAKSKFKESLLIQIFKEFTEDELRNASISFSTYFIKNSIKKSALESIQIAKNNKDQICIVTASLDVWMIDIAEKLKLDLICTESAFIDNTFAGFKSKNCIGKTKVDRVISKYSIDKYQDVLCFGDSKGDEELLKLGTKNFYKYFS
jgi:phosphatidylglycerophosphatase C|tara:strand:- start:1639 stop:2223 length:585 start_codon:yes stop_codon:yes gene_type:complete